VTIDAAELADRFDKALAVGLQAAWSDSFRGKGIADGLHHSTFDITRCLEELSAIRTGADFCYDRPGSAFAYAAWYHGERVNQFMGVLAASKSLDERERAWRIVDLGAGTGAVAWALAGREILRAAAGDRRPPLILEMVESSRPMLRLAMLLWNALLDEFRAERIGDLVQVDSSRGWRHESWPSMVPAAAETDLMTAHYLFDHSEAEPESASESVYLFRKQMRHQRVSRLLCCTTSQKQPILNRLRQELASAGWQAATHEVVPGPLQGTLRRVGVFRQGRAANIEDKRLMALGSAAPDFRGKARSPAVLLFAEGSGLFREPAGAGDVLTKEQGRALVDQGCNVSIRGAAGSGKTLVLSLRLANRLRQGLNRLGPSPILFTSFNTRLVRKASEDTFAFVRSMSMPADAARFKLHRDSGCLAITFDGETHARFMTFDSVVTRLFALRPSVLGGADDSPFDLAKRIVADERNAARVGKLPQAAFPLASPGEESAAGRSVVRSAQFLASEFRTVFYGRARCIKSLYLDPGSVDRSGRVVPLSAVQRAACADLLSAINHKFTNRRVAALQSTPRHVFSEIVVDEAQDFTDADFCVMSRLCAPDARWTIAFDSSQAIRTGVTFKAPKVVPDWSRSRLTGSYRMPLRVCEALVPVVNHIRSQQAVLGVDSQLLAAPPVPSRLAVLGSRPMVVAAPDEESFSRRIAELVHTFDPPLETKPALSLVVLEKDRDLASALRDRFGRKSRIVAEASSVLMEKGMEFPWVVWSTRTPCEEPLDLHRLCYTVVSRCTRHLVIWLQTDARGRPNLDLTPVFAGAGALRRDRLLAIDADADDALRGFD